MRQKVWSQHTLTTESPEMSSTPNTEVVIGVDYGTLSGRAVVVRVADGAELASAEYVYPHAVMDTELTAGPQRVSLPPDWALQVRVTTSMCSSMPFPRPCVAPGSRRAM